MFHTSTGRAGLLFPGTHICEEDKEWVGPLFGDQEYLD